MNRPGGGQDRMGCQARRLALPINRRQFGTKRRKSVFDGSNIDILYTNLWGGQVWSAVELTSKRVTAAGLTDFTSVEFMHGRVWFHETKYA